MAGLAVLTVLYLVMILADFIAPYNFTATHRNFIYAPPTKIRFFDEDGRWRGPFVYPLTRSRDPVTFQLVFTEDRSRIVPVKLFVPGEEYKLMGLFKTNLHLFGVEESPDTAMVLPSGPTGLAGAFSLACWWEARCR